MTNPDDSPIKRHTRAPFTIVPNAVMDDDRLSWKAKGILAYLLGKPDGWIVRVQDLVNRGNDGKSAVRAALDELREAGYVFLETHRDNGKFGGSIWHVSDAADLKNGPTPCTENRDAVPHTDKRDTENRHLSKKDRSQIDCTYPLAMELESSEMQDAWDDWQRHRREKKKPLTATAAKRQMAKLVKMGHDRALAALEHSLSNGWDGIFEPKEDGRAKPKPTPTKPKVAQPTVQSFER